MSGLLPQPRGELFPFGEAGRGDVFLELQPELSRQTLLVVGVACLEVETNHLHQHCTPAEVVPLFRQAEGFEDLIKRSILCCELFGVAEHQFLQELP